MWSTCCIFIALPGHLHHFEAQLFKSSSLSCITCTLSDSVLLGECKNKNLGAIVLDYIGVQTCTEITKRGTSQEMANKLTRLIN